MWRSATIGVVVLGTPMAAQANEFTYSWGATIASEYVSNGVFYSDGPTVQPWVEFGYAGLYFGAYVSNVDENFTGADVETGVAVGYRGVVGPVNYDASLNYYMYTEAFPGPELEDSAEFIVSAYVAATESLYVTGRVALAPEYDATNLRLRLDYYTPVEGLSIGGAYGTADTNYGDWEYWTIDASYAVSENVSLGLAYHDSTYNEKVWLGPDGNGVDDGLVVASIDFSFRPSLTGRALPAPDSREC